MHKYVLAILAAFAALVAVVVPASAAPAQQDLKLLHSFGYKHLLLGMSAKQAEATGLVKYAFGGDVCSYYTLNPSEGERNANVVVGIHRDLGVQVIDATNPMTTSRGIHIGSTRKELMAAYPDTHRHPVIQGLEVANTPLNPRAEFGFAIGFRDTVDWMLVRTKEVPSC